MWHECGAFWKKCKGKIIYENKNKEANFKNEWMNKLSKSAGELIQRRINSEVN